MSTRAMPKVPYRPSSHPALRRPDSPTLRVGSPPADGFAEVHHRVPMLSLDNAMNAEEMRAFDERIRRELGDEEVAVAYVGEPKLDGAGIELVYENGVLTVGTTRGDGRTGEDVTANLRKSASIPLSLETDAPARVSVRGEVTLPVARFERLNRARLAREQDPFANPRNAAAGALRQLHDLDVERLRALEFRAYALGEGVPPNVTTSCVLGSILKTQSALLGIAKQAPHGNSAAPRPIPKSSAIVAQE